MAEIIAAPVAEKVVESLFTLIGRHMGYLWKYRSNISDLTLQIEKLRDGRVRVQQSVDEANRQGDEIFPDVQKWLSRAEEMIEETDKFIADEREANKGCFHLRLRYQHSKKAKGQTGDILIKIQESGNFGTVSHRPPPPGIGSSSLGSSQVFKSRETTLNQIMEALRDDGIRMIGVWGMGGVGKTTLIQQVAKRAQVAKQANEEKLFETVVMALNISQTPNLTKIQGEIASMLGLKLEEGDESQRAVRLSQSLKKHKKILVILDDIWEPMAFERIGIPYGSDDHQMGSCKVLLTSREHDVLSKDMGTHKDFHIQHLSEEEAWSLFKQMTGDSMEKSELQPIATKVVKECEGLPVAIVTIAKALKGESVGVWRNALEELRRSEPTNIRGVSKNVYSCLELSYNHLESEQVKLVFLLCGLLGNDDISLDDLLKYVMSFDLFHYMDSLEKARDKVVTLVKTLKASSLLLDVIEDAITYREPPSSYFVEEEGKGYVRMHDVIRDVARSIASKDPHRFMVMNEDDSLEEWEKRGVQLRNCTGMSLKYRGVQELPEGLVCPKLGFFLLNNNYYFLRIPDSFFEEMKEVRVLSLSVPHLAQLPSSLQFLSNLRTLCLHGYGYWLGKIEMVGELKKLQILSFEGYKMSKLPESMKQLTDLRMLSLRRCQAFIPRNVISSLSRLEHLCLRNVSDRWEGRGGVEGGERNAWFSELKHLSCLRALEVEIPGPCLLPKDVSFENLTRYDIFIGYQRESIVDNARRNTSRGLKLNEVKGPHLAKCFSKLFKTIEVLDLRYLDDIKHFVHELECYGFLHLKYLSVYRSNTLQYIMNTMKMECLDPPPPSTFPLLEKLMLKELKELEAVCHGPIPMGCFASLRVLVIEKCRSLKCVICLPTRRESILEFPQLRQLELSDLPNIVDFYSTAINESQEPFIIPFFNQIALPKLELLISLYSIKNVRTMWHNKYPVSWCCKLKKLQLRSCTNLETVFPYNFLEGLESLQILEIDGCPSLKEIFEMDSITNVVVPPWKELSLHGHQNTKASTIRYKHPQGCLAFQNLKSLWVYKCGSLKYVFLSSVAKGLVQLEVLEISYCEVVEEIVVNENGPENEAVAPTFLFPRLSSLKLSDLRQLKRFYGQREEMYTLECPLLEKLVVHDCDNVELLFQEKCLQDHQVADKQQPLFLVNKNTFPNVEELEVRLRSTMEIWGGQFSRESFGKLRNLEIVYSHNISVAIPCSKLQDWNNLERLTLRSCHSVKEIIKVDEGVVVGETFPQLTEMHLEDLPMLTHLFGIGLRPLLQNLHSLEVSKCGKLINIVSSSMAKRLVQLKKLSITHCSMVEEMVGDDDDDDASTKEEEALTVRDADDICFSTTKLDQKKPQPDHHLVKLENFSSASSKTFAFPSLEEMEVKELPRLSHLCNKIPGLGHDLQNLRILKVSDCGNLEILFTLSMAKTLVQLQELIVEDCAKVKEIIAKNKGGGDHQATDVDDGIIFTKLEKLKLKRLPNLKSFCSARYTFRFPWLTDMWVTECPEMEYFCEGDSTTERLKTVKVDYYGSYWENSLNATIHKIFMEVKEALLAQSSEEEDLEERPDSEGEVLDEDDAEEGDSEEQLSDTIWDREESLWLKDARTFWA